jgi:hypothetical protein
MLCVVLLTQCTSHDGSPSQVGRDRRPLLRRQLRRSDGRARLQASSRGARHQGRAESGLVLSSHSPRTGQFTASLISNLTAARSASSVPTFPKSTPQSQSATRSCSTTTLHAQKPARRPTTPSNRPAATRSSRRRRASTRPSTRPSRRSCPSSSTSASPTSTPRSRRSSACRPSSPKRATSG